MLPTEYNVTRRRFVRIGAHLALWPLTACGAHTHATEDRPESEVGFSPLVVGGRRVLRIGSTSAPPLVLLHELPGMTPDDMRLARRLAQENFNVYLPLLFGDVGQDSTTAGYWQACARGPFECSDLSARSEVLTWIEGLCDTIAKDTAGGSAKGQLGVIGMCLTGIFPLALLRPGVAAAVACQPTVPFRLIPPRPVGKQKKDLGLSAADLARASKSDVPFLAMRYASDALCPAERMGVIRDTFKTRVAVIEIPNKKGHSTLASSFDPDAFADTVSYLKVRLKSDPGPRRMKLATLSGRPCEITAGGMWANV